MADVHSIKTRSYNMSRIRSKNTKPEMIVRKFLFAQGFRYRLNDKRFIGKPDIVLPKYKTIIFVHGCFWHGHQGCKYFTIPETRTDWWLNKIKGNKARDKKNEEELTILGWRVLIIYECELKPTTLKETTKNLIEAIKHYVSK